MLCFVSISIHFFSNISCFFYLLQYNIIKFEKQIFFGKNHKFYKKGNSSCIISSSESLIALGKTLSLVDYPFSDTDGIAVYAELTAEKHVISVHYQEDGWHVSAPTVAAAARGLGMVLAEQEGDFSVQFQVMGILLDCSRGKVFHETFLKKFCAQSALLGYNLLSLYTEDTFKMEDEPFFGYCRGGYDIPTLQRLDDFTAALGMELTGAIQTLGHMASMLHWGAAYA